jgi:hypothetical protein
MSRATAGFAFAFCVSACVLLAGCAAPGDPTARHPVVPAAITDLTAHQSGSAVILTFTLPRQSTDHEPLAEPPAIEIYRAALPPGAAPGGKTAWRQVYTIPSERVDSYVNRDRVEFHDPLTSEDSPSTAGSLMAYLVRTRASKIRASGDSNFSTARIYPAPEAPRDLRLSVSESAIEISWTGAISPEAPTQAAYRVFRAEIEPGAEAAPRDFSQVKLRAPIEMAGVSSAPDFLDSHFEFGRTYLYTVRAVAQFGLDSIESEDSEPAVVTPRDTFPPAAPRDLVGAVIPETSETHAYVELSWAIGSEADLAGYYVYRSDREDTSGERINAEILPGPAFRDISVVAGKRYFYRVSAEDQAGNESSRSSAVQIEVP